MILRFIYMILLASMLKSFDLDDKSFDINSKYNQSISVQHETLEQRNLSFPLEDLINQDEYILGPGDGVYINIVTSNKIVNLNLFVSPTGDVLVPVVGIINVNGLTVKDGFLKIKNKCLDKYNDSSVSLTLSNIREFRIKALGPFNESGIYISTSVSRVSDIYDQILRKNSNNSKLNKRSIILKRDNSDYSIDLMKFYLFGNENENPFLRAGDELYFNFIDEYITISGGVKSPGNYPCLPGESLSDILRLSGGFKFNADSEEILISRYINEKKIDILIEKDFFPETEVLPFDFINIKIKNNHLIHSIVEIKGEVINPGLYSIVEGESSIKDLLDKAGGYTSFADRDKILFTSKYAEKYSQELKGAYHDYVDKSYRLDNPDDIRFFYSSNKTYTNEVLDYKLYDNDIVEVPKYHPFIEIIGAVQYPGLYEFNENYSIDEYIYQAGGIKETETKDIFIIKAHTNQRIKYDNKSKIESGDVLYVVEKINWDKRTKVLDTVSIAQALASTFSMILTIYIAIK